MYNSDLKQREVYGSVDMDYLKSPLGILKVAEIFCLLIAFASLSGFTFDHKDPKYGGRYDFFYFATVTSWLLVIILFVLFLLRLYERLAINWNLVMAVYSPVTAFLVLVSSALVIDSAVFYRRDEILNPKDLSQYVHYCSVFKCGNVEAAGAFGVICMALFAVDTALYCMRTRNTGSASSAPPPDPDVETYSEKE